MPPEAVFFLAAITLRQIRHDVDELSERLDFTERLLAQQREGERLAPPRSS